MKNLSSDETRLLNSIQIDFNYDLSLARPGAKRQLIEALAKEIMRRVCRDR